jgi:putative transposase
MSKFQNKYRIETSRANWWNYAAKGSYFITICAAGRQCLFGEIIKKTMYLSDIGKIVYEEWERSFRIRKELICDAFILMPDHLHAILFIDEPSFSSELPKNPILNEAEHNPILSDYGVAWRPPKSISSFVAGFKSSATKRINEYRQTPRKPVWQARFHDHLIRNREEYYRVKKYIETNPDKWKNNENLNSLNEFGRYNY